MENNIPSTCEDFGHSRRLRLRDLVVANVPNLIADQARPAKYDEPSPQEQTITGTETE